MPHEAPRSPAPSAPERSSGWWPLIWVAVVMLTLFFLGRALIGTTTVQPIPYSRFLALVQANRVVKVEIGSQTVSGIYKQGSEQVEFRSTRRRRA